MTTEHGRDVLTILILMGIIHLRPYLIPHFEKIKVRRVWMTTEHDQDALTIPTLVGIIHLRLYLIPHFGKLRSGESG